jgi:hypothetical protein
MLQRNWQDFEDASKCTVVGSRPIILTDTGSLSHRETNESGR